MSTESRKYVYVAIDSRGERLSGELEATDPDAVVSQLTARGLRIESVQLAAGARGSAVAERSSAAGLSPSDTREVGRHISEIVSANLPLESGLAAIAEEFPFGSVKRALRSIVSDLEAGDDLESALAHHRAAGYLPALVRAGQRSGRTGEILENFIVGSQAVSELRHTLWMALAYPLILIFMLIPLILVLQLKIVPQFGDVFDGFEIKLPVLTKALLVTSQTFREHGLKVLLMMCGAVVLLVIAFRLMLGRLAARRVICNIPVLGTILRWTALARFSPLLASLLEARVPLDEALLLAGDASGDAEVEDDCRTLAASLRSGNSLAEAIRSTGRLPSSFVGALGWIANEHGFPDVLRSMSDVYAGRARALVMLIAVILPPLAVVFVAGSVGTIVVLLFMPLIELLNKLS